ncbi:MAG: hypothetical protein AAGI07_07290 [Bacteroidota bacterium]
MASRIEFDHVTVFRATEKSYIPQDKPCFIQTFKMGIPEIDIECSRIGIVQVTP